MSIAQHQAFLHHRSVDDRTFEACRGLTRHRALMAWSQDDGLAGGWNPWNPDFAD